MKSFSVNWEIVYQETECQSRSPSAKWGKLQAWLNSGRPGRTQVSTQAGSTQAGSLRHLKANFYVTVGEFDGLHLDSIRLLRYPFDRDGQGFTSDVIQKALDRMANFVVFT